jgi:FkbM family methyltransferase
VSGFQRDLIFDIGYHRGEDSAYYLAKGYRVVAFEADPDLAEAGRRRFASEMEAGRFILVEGAVAPPGSVEVCLFYRNLDRTTWGTLDADRARRNAAYGKRSQPVSVRMVDLSKVIDEYGVPYYAKTDIEGADQVALDALLGRSVVPKYISWESDKLSLDTVAAELDLLREAGFDRFQVVQQLFIPGHQARESTLAGTPLTYRFPDGASGPFGEDLGGDWLDRDQALARYRTIFRDYQRWGDASLARRILTEKVLDRVARLTRVALPGWFDTHARWAG